MKSSATIDAYIADFPKDVGKLLTQMRTAISEAAPLSAQRPRRICCHTASFAYNIGMGFRIWRRGTKQSNPSQGEVSENKNFIKLPKTLKELDPGYRVLIKELGKR